MTNSGPSRHLFADVLARVHAVCSALADEGALPAGLDLSRIVVEPPRDAVPRRHGDQRRDGAGEGRQGRSRASSPRRSPQSCAPIGLIDKAEIAGPGFINLTLKPRSGRMRCAPCCARATATAAARSARAKRSTSNTSRPIRPGRCMSAIAAARCSATRWPSLLAFAGYDVTREYYINDAGAQVDVLARSAFLRYREALGEDIGAIPEGLYPGDYLKPVGAGARRRIRRQAAERQPEARMAAARARQRDRHDDGR